MKYHWVFDRPSEAALKTRWPLLPDVRLIRWSNRVSSSSTSSFPFSLAGASLCFLRASSKIGPKYASTIFMLGLLLSPNISAKGHIHPSSPRLEQISCTSENALEKSSAMLGLAACPGLTTLWEYGKPEERLSTQCPKRNSVAESKVNLEMRSYGRGTWQWDQIMKGCWDFKLLPGNRSNSLREVSVSSSSWCGPHGDQIDRNGRFGREKKMGESWRDGT